MTESQIIQDKLPKLEQPLIDILDDPRNHRIRLIKIFLDHYRSKSINYSMEEERDECAYVFGNLLKLIDAMEE